MKTVLSTKILTPSQKELFLNSGLGLVEYDALHIELLETEIPSGYESLIFTSKNAVKGFLNLTKDLDHSNIRVFCVGDKTKAVLLENRLNVVKSAENAFELANFIVKKHKNDRFLFLCGNRRREELPETLKKNNIQYKECVVYQAHPVHKKFDRFFDGLLFFSPSGVRSFLLENSIGSEVLFCIGGTTTAEAKKHSSHIITASTPTVENVLVQAIKHFKKA